MKESAPIEAASISYITGVASPLGCHTLGRNPAPFDSRHFNAKAFTMPGV